ncbi:hypothetical protein [Streptomyces sp. NPDC050560]|uniref:hypothetical protein n=1 Tax=Streptomyces sp. NPDC050560 TaxID=3365630 RepID=UPI0037B76807
MSAAAVTAGRLARLPVARARALRAYGDELLAGDDTGLAVRLLAAAPTNEGRETELLRGWAGAAAAFGAGLAEERGAAVGPARVEERGGGLADSRLLLARFVSRPRPTVVLYADTLALAGELTALLGWERLFPPGSVRAAAVAHECAHRLLHEPAVRRGLKEALGHRVFSAGRLRVLGHVAGADEVAAHAYAQRLQGLERGPLLLTAALARAVAMTGLQGPTSEKSRGPRWES